MQIFRGYETVGDALSGAALAIGNFDGLHRGHQSLFAEAKARAERAAVLTFDPHPVQVLAPHLAPPLLMTPEEKLAGLGEHGLSAVVVQPFDAAFAATAPSAFVQDILIAGLKVGYVVVGPDFNFGKGGKGDTALLDRLLGEADVGLSVMPPVKEGGMVCSSSQVRQFVLEGRVDVAALLLGHPFWLEGTVEAGDGRGKTIGIPTANLTTARQALPKVGVYATWLRINGTPHASVTNIGLRPTFSGAGVRIETHVLDLPKDTDLYGQSLRLSFVQRLREERRFSGADALVAQIHQDIADARNVLDATR
jgi:riboflavin kinase/FMN adenylyltransferase